MRRSFVRQAIVKNSGEKILKLKQDKFREKISHDKFFSQKRPYPIEWGRWGSKIAIGESNSAKILILSLITNRVWFR